MPSTGALSRPRTRRALSPSGGGDRYPRGARPGVNPVLLPVPLKGEGGTLPRRALGGSNPPIDPAGARGGHGGPALDTVGFGSGCGFRASGQGGAHVLAVRAESEREEQAQVGGAVASASSGATVPAEPPQPRNVRRGQDVVSKGHVGGHIADRGGRRRAASSTYARPLDLRSSGRGTGAQRFVRWPRRPTRARDGIPAGATPSPRRRCRRTTTVSRTLEP